MPAAAKPATRSNGPAMVRDRERGRDGVLMDRIAATDGMARALRADPWAARRRRGRRDGAEGHNVQRTDLSAAAVDLDELEGGDGEPLATRGDCFGHARAPSCLLMRSKNACTAWGAADCCRIGFGRDGRGSPDPPFQWQPGGRRGGVASCDVTACVAERRRAVTSAPDPVLVRHDASGHDSSPGTRPPWPPASCPGTAPADR